MLCWSKDSSAPRPEPASAARTRARRYSCRRRKLTRSSKSTWVWPGAPIGRFQLWCGSISSGRTIVGSADFFGLAIYPRTTLRSAKYATPDRPRTTVLLGFYPRGLDQLRVRNQLLLDHRLEVWQRHAQRLDAELEETLAHVRRGDRGVDLLVEARRNVARRLGRDQRADPKIVVGVRVAGFDRGGNVGKERAALRRAYGERAQLAFLHLRTDLERQREIEIGAARYHLGEGVGRALHRKLEQLDSGGDAEARELHVRRAADARGRGDDGPGLGLRGGDQIGHALVVLRGRDDEHRGHHADRRHRREILRVERPGRNERRDGEGRSVDADEVTVGLPLGDVRSADQAARAELVLDDDGLAHARLHLFRDDARGGVRGAPGRDA